MRRTLKLAVTAIATGALAGSAAFASALITPPMTVVPTDAASPAAAVSPVAGPAETERTVNGLDGLLGDTDVAGRVVSLLDGAEGLPEGQLYVGAAKRNLYPTPDEEAGE